MMRKYRYFSENEFMRAVPACRIEKMDVKFMNRLDRARHVSGVDFIILSAFRSIEWEKRKGRTGTSSHTKGVAVDIRCDNSIDRLKIINALLKVRFKRIGVYNTFIHVDSDDDKIDCMFLG